MAFNTWVAVHTGLLCYNRTMIKAVFLDLDGTLLPFGGTQATALTEQALIAAHEAGYRLFVSTGRHLPNIDGIDRSLFEGFISLNGQYCVHGDELIRSHAIPHADILALLDYLEAYPFSCAFIERDYAYVNQGSARYDRVSSFIHLNMPIRADYRRAADHPILQCLFFLDEDSQAAPLQRMKAVTHTRWHPDFIDVVPLGGGKGEGVLAMLEHIGLSTDEILCIGDGENDISMLEIAGTAVVMGQASDRVKSYADFVTADVEGEGVYRAFQHFGIGNLPALD